MCCPSDQSLSTLCPPLIWVRFRKHTDVKTNWMKNNFAIFIIFLKIFVRNIFILRMPLAIQMSTLTLFHSSILCHGVLEIFVNLYLLSYISFNNIDILNPGNCHDLRVWNPSWYHILPKRLIKELFNLSYSSMRHTIQYWIYTALLN